MTAAVLALARRGEAESARALGEDTSRRSRRVFHLDHLITRLLAQAIGIGHPILDADAAEDHPGRPLCTFHAPSATCSLAQ